MKDLPAQVTGLITGLTLKSRRPAFLKADQDGRLELWGGELAAYGIAEPALGQPAGEWVYYLEGLLPQEPGDPLFLPRIETESGLSADIHIFADSNGVFVIFLDASAETEYLGQFYQNSNELSLLASRIAKMLGLDGKNQDEIVPKVEAQLKIARLSKELMQANELLEQRQRLLDDDLHAAAQIQRSLLPRQQAQVHGAEFAWEFLPCNKVGGDIFNLVPLDARYTAAYMLDVSGHGVPAALVSVSVSHLMQAGTGFLQGPPQPEIPTGPVLSPQQVMERLDREFPIERFEKIFTMFYLLLDRKRRQLSYSNAGHPPPVLLSPEGRVKLILPTGPLIGMGGMLPHGQAQLEPEPGSKLVIYTDGVVEYADAKDRLFGQDRFLELLTSCHRLPLAELLQTVTCELEKFGGAAPPKDDVSMLGLEF